MKTPFKSLALAALIATIGFTAYAQGPGMMNDHHSTMSEGRMHKMDPAKMSAMVDKHLNELKTKLKITPAQEPAWTTFTSAMKPSGKMQDKRPDRAELAKLSTPERIDKMRALRTQHMTEMQSAMDKRDDATKAFYATLSPEQQKVFDSEHARMGKQRR